MNKLILPPDHEKEVDKKPTNVVPFERPVTGGGGGIPSDWLKGLKEQTVFLARPRDKQPINLTEYHIIAQNEKSTLLFVRDPSGGSQDVYVYVDPKIFSIHFELFEIIKDGETAE
jgi:hypothetical protein